MQLPFPRSLNCVLPAKVFSSLVSTTVTTDDPGAFGLFSAIRSADEDETCAIQTHYYYYEVTIVHYMICLLSLHDVAPVLLIRMLLSRYDVIIIITILICYHNSLSPPHPPAPRRGDHHPHNLRHLHQHHGLYTVSQYGLGLHAFSPTHKPACFS